MSPAPASINATLEVDFLGQCASESLGSEYWSSSGGQPDFARARAILSEHGQSFIVLHSTTADESISRIVAQLHPGAAVTTFNNVVDCVVTEYGVAELRGSSIRERTRKLIGIAIRSSVTIWSAGQGSWIIFEFLLTSHPLQDFEEPINFLFCIVEVWRDAHALPAHADEDIVGR